MKVGVLGGTFDPVHVGHLAVAEEVACRLGLDRVLFVPAGKPWLKAGNHITAGEHRLKMIELAITGKKNLAVSVIELERPGPTYTVDTLEQLKTRPTDECYFIIGRDKLAELPEWHQPERLIKMCRLVAVPRVGCPVLDLASLETAIPGISQRVIMLDRPRVDVSASGIRKRVRQGLDISGLVPEAVERYIEEQGLYRG